MQIVSTIQKFFKDHDCKYSDGKKSDCAWYNLADVCDPVDD